MAPTMHLPLRFAGLLLAVLALAACERRTEPRPGGSGSDADLWAYPVSQIFLPRDPRQPALALRKAEEIHAELRAGRDFAEVARALSEDPQSKELGGFMGFLRPRGEDPLFAAIQALPPNVASFPVDGEAGVRFLLRHTFEEGRRLEAETTIPAYGFFLPWRELNPNADRSKAEARALADDTVAALRKGQKTLGQAAKALAPFPPERDDAWLGMIRNTGVTRELYGRLAAVPPGGYVDPFETPEGFAILQRKAHLRALVRHILVRHRESPNRPLSLSRSREEAKARAEEVLGKADLTGANWDDLVRRYSDDTESVAIGGRIGVVGNGDLFPTLEDALVEAEPGRVLDRLVETPEGFHILYRER